MAIINLTEQDFDREVKETSAAVVVNFWADWCGHCKELAPILDEICKKSAGRAKVCKVNVDEQPALAARFGITSIPTLIFFEKGEMTGKMVGVRDKKDIWEALSL